MIKLDNSLNMTVSTFGKIMLILTALIWFNTTSLYFRNPVKENPSTTSETQNFYYINNNNDAFSEDAFKNYLKKIKIKFPEIVIAQAKLETDNFKSDIFKIGNNLFGMKPAYQRTTTWSYIYKGHAAYVNWKESVLDYALFQEKYFKNIKTKEEYFKNLLKQSYAEDPFYVFKLKEIIKTVKL